MYLILLLSIPITAAEPPYSANEAHKHFRLADDLVIELIASEPQVKDPVAIAWDATGKLYVAEMGDYPALASGGRVRQLVDEDGDGTFERSFLFAEGLPHPTSVLPWKQGILVAAAPNILYLEDSDGDGKADQEESLIVGFGEGNQQLRVNGLTYGLDNWIYGANGRSNGTIHFTKDSKQPSLPLANHDFRFRPDSKQIELTSGFSQFGIAFDDWGHQFLSWNTIPLRHVVIEQRYLNRNPFQLSAEAVADIADPADAGRIYAVTSPQPRFNREPTGYFNASCGVTVDRGGLFSGDVKGSAFVCEPLGNVVHRKVLVPRGPTFLGKRSPAEQTSEFLASNDPWFHPVNLASGPDGALYVVDFYREWVEHPQFVPDDLEKGIDFTKGSGHGRIWRIKPREAKLVPPLNLADLPTDALVDHLASPVGWVRTTAQRLLVERQDQKVREQLVRLATESASPLARLHALWTLDGLGVLEDGTIQTTLAGLHPEVRRSAIRLSEDRLTSSAPLQHALIGLIDDPEISVRLQLACTLGLLDSAASLGALAMLAKRDGAGEWMQRAILSSVGQQPVTFLVELSKQSGDAPSSTTLKEEVATTIGVANEDDQIRDLLNWLSTTRPPDASAILFGLAKGLEHRGSKLVDRCSSLVPNAKELFSSVVSGAQTDLSDRALPSILRARAASILGYDESPKSDKALQRALSDPEIVVRQAAIQSLGKRENEAVAYILLKAWPDATASLRRDIALTLLKSPDRAHALLDALEAGTIERAQLDLDCRQRLRETVVGIDRQKVESLLSNPINADRQTIVERYRPDATKAGDHLRGESHFQKKCSTCHRIRGKGPLVGPELSGLVTKTPDQLLVDILDPSREVLPNFIGFVAVTKDGELHSGLLGAETATAITLRKQEGKDQVLLREELEEFRATGKSLMPDGFEQDLSPADLADLIAYLRQIQR